MSLSETDQQFIRANPSAAMITIARDGTPKVARVGVALVDGRLWSSATNERVRTKRLRRDPRCVLYVHDAGAWWLTLETTVTILDGPDAPQLNLRLMRQMQGKPEGALSWFGRELEEDDFLQVMVEEQRVVYEFTVQHAYGMH
jgi:PPOX class probable F420-dependent enzyme